MNYALIVFVNKFVNTFETKQQTFICSSIEETKDKLINYLSNEFSCMNIDYPLELADFEFYWFGEKYVNTNSFYYKIFANDIWSEPWDSQEIYNDVLDKMHEIELNNPPNFEEIHGEPDPDSEVIDNFSMENNEQIHELEKKLTEIVEQAKLCEVQDGAQVDEIKECKCLRCIKND